MVAYALACDAAAMRDSDDPFLCSPIIGKYEREFTEFADRQIYQPGGMINTELLVLYCLIRHTKPELFIESGTMNGYSSVFIAEALRRNGTGAKLYCLSLFEDGEEGVAAERLRPYGFAEIRNGYSELLIDQVIQEHGKERVAILIDGPKARSESWDILTSKIANNFPQLLFLCFDAAQEHVPYYSPEGSRYLPKRSINVERWKVIRHFENGYRGRGYKLVIQSNQFCRRYQYLNEKIYRYRNERWGRSFPWGPFRVDRFDDHLAFSYKMAVIYRDKILEESGKAEGGKRKDEREEENKSRTR